MTRPRFAALSRWVAVPVRGHARGVWLLWAATALVLLSVPELLMDPAAWTYLVDPELAVLLVLLGVQATRLQLGILRIRALDAWHAVTRRA
ncbi:hypothetical protein GCM10025864_33920 [Luteimicrobium album]|uniref:Uncharacterized protein n=1 Tax=Luteimicrobium album TaxID=1054550 RepID=A0ABQ6I4E2_9MICO|nr:hypothetical protein [Luteimicrobium album]GMA25633.1 hypothetical protein GCM10025864_33920 [Luteimicrobium album]